MSLANQGWVLDGMANKLLNLSRRDEGWAGLMEGADRDHYFRSDRRRSLCGGVVVLSAIGALTESGGKMSCCRACNDRHLAELERIAALEPARCEVHPGWEPRGGKQKRHFFGEAAVPGAIRTSLCNNAILLHSLRGLRPGYEVREHNCSTCWNMARRGVLFVPLKRPPTR